MQFRVLGPVAVETDDGPVDLSHQQRKLLAVLLANADQPVSTGTIAEDLWADGRPADPQTAIQTLVSRTRSRLGPEAVVTHPSGYLIRTRAPHRLDSREFSEMVREAEGMGPSAAGLYQQALEMWTGPPFGEFADLPSVRLEAVQLGERRARAAEAYARALIDGSRLTDAIGLLRGHMEEHPFRERPRALLMEALYRDGRQPEALRVYADYRRLLVEELGVDPSWELQQLEMSLLDGTLPLGSPVRREEPPRFPLGARLGSFERAPAERVSYASIGAGIPPVVVLPGWISSLDHTLAGSDPRALLTARLAERHQVFVYDRYATGLSRGTTTDFSLETSVAELVALLEELDLRSVPLVAASASGPVALAAAARTTRVSKLALLGTFASGPEVFTNPRVRASLLDIVRSSWGLGSRILTTLLLPAADADATAEFAEFQQGTATPEVAAGYLEQMYAADASPLLGQV
ncbi:MAG: alpha/beta fold hydrolase, partial [Actinomycetota bacterium]